MGVDPRTPVIVGVGQLNRRVDEGEEPMEPVDMLVEALRIAAADSGSTDGARLLAAADLVGVNDVLSWRYADPGALVAQRLGAEPRRTLFTRLGGNSPQMLVNHVCAAIQRGDLDVALVGGAEAWRTRIELRGQDQRPPWTPFDESAPRAELLGDDTPMNHPAELARGVIMPVQVYPMFETALRAALGRDADDHQQRIATMWSRFSEVAAANPHAWIRQRFTPEDIATPGPDNRMIGYPYTKRMCSNNAVEQSAAVIVCSAEAADRHGVPRERWVFPLSGVDVHDTYYVSHRENLHTSPAIRVGGRAVLGLAGASGDDLAHVDLYSCFPSAVQVAARELGLPDDDPGRPLTVTGGLTFAGGPWNNYTTHAIAAMVGRLRDEPGTLGLCTANGGLLTKHALGVYGTVPPSDGFRWVDAQPEADAATSPRSGEDDYEGTAEIEAYTVMHDRDGRPETALASVLTPAGTRAWATSTDPDSVAALLAEEGCGRKINVAAGGVLQL